MSKRAREHRSIPGFLTHAAVFAAMLVFLTVQGEPPIWMVFWGVGLFSHGLKTFWPRRVEGAPEPQPLPESEPQAEPEHPLLAVLDRIAHEDLPVDVAALRRAAGRMIERRERLARLGTHADRARLEEERAALLARLDAASSEVERETLERERDALSDRMAELEAVLEVVDGLDAQARTLLNQLETLRMRAARASAMGDESPDLAEQTEAMRAELDAATEVEEHLARARRAARARLKG